METAQAKRWNPFTPIMEAEQSLYQGRQAIRDKEYEKARNLLVKTVERCQTLINDIDSMPILRG